MTDKITVEKYRLTCDKCGYSWYSGTMSTRETTCANPRCRSYVRLPSDLITRNAGLRK